MLRASIATHGTTTTAMTSTFPDYYALLNVAQTATQDEIRTAYKRESLKSVFPCAHNKTAVSHVYSYPGHTPTDS